MSAANGWRGAHGDANGEASDADVDADVALEWRFGHVHLARLPM